MRTDDFDFDLPDELIALRPAAPREAARMLVIGREKGIIAETRIAELPAFLNKGDALVLNDTRVIPGALAGFRERNGASTAISVNLLRRTSPSQWQAFAKPGRRLKTGDRLEFSKTGIDLTLSATLAAKGEGGEVLLSFDLDGGRLDHALDLIGAMPLPPYIAARRPADRQDEADYQTVYADRKGSVAAPTAGLHLTGRLLERLHSRAILTEKVTLHVGAGTFLPVKTERVEDHVMHAEWGEVGTDTARRLADIRAGGGRIIAAGTTSARLLESAARASGSLAAFSGQTDIFITPGYRFLAIDGLLTNFHLPRSTLFMLVAAFAGTKVMKEAYAHAIRARYRFFSYGDACLLLPGE